ncbi:hypothetical protein H1R17_05860 [Flavobacterium sp. xlx-214]|uniref:hypothetical protein n=1 Tax=unclassified Flavobacterium TaxID=196869 RepID=UPI0013D758FD|nr:MULTISPECIES: hypothetical protein [unclassified Flavobacterium]MBA5793023.1 hypothetical protein [Flavobacterium sp. xlx-221]QMI84649.1 hypothetical protein H1R17_05860 [Flavobacterium sp. xlx-214]
MKRFFLYAVAITALCSACETENEVFATETKEQSNTLHQAKGVKTNDYQTYQSIMNSFVYNKSQTYEKNLLLFEEHVNQQILNYVKQETYSYEKINQEQLLVLKRADATFIEQLAYTKEAKQAIQTILSNRFTSDAMQLIINEDEQNLIATLFALQGNGNDDDLLNGKRRIAFAYGAQYSFTQAVLYAGAIELLAKY